MSGSNRAARVDAAPVRKSDVHQDDIRLECQCLGHSRCHGTGFTDYLEVSGFREQSPQTDAKDFVIIHQEDLDGLHIRP
jgi:hypothetical protein